MFSSTLQKGMLLLAAWLLAIPPWTVSACGTCGGSPVLHQDVVSETSCGTTQWHLWGYVAKTNTTIDLGTSNYSYGVCEVYTDCDCNPVNRVLTGDLTDEGCTYNALAKYWFCSWSTSNYISVTFHACTSGSCENNGGTVPSETTTFVNPYDDFYLYC